MLLSKKSQQGQILLIVILVMVVSLTVGLSVVTRTITNVRTSQEEQASQQAFSAAEAGIEKIISSNQTTLEAQLPNDASYQTSITTASGTAFLVNNGNTIVKDDGIDVWLSTYPNYSSPFSPSSSGSVTVYWSNSSDVCDASPSLNTKAALEIVILSGTSPANATVRHVPVDPCSSRAAINNFTHPVSAGGTVQGKTFGHSYTVTGITNGLLMRVIPVYASTTLAVSGNGTALPSQGQIIQSVGTSGGTQRKIVVYKGYPKVPVEFFPFLLFSPQ